MLAGVTVPTVQAVEFAFWADPKSSHGGRLVLRAVRADGLDAPRRFAGGFAMVVTADLAASLGPGATLQRRSASPWWTGVVMLLVRRVIGDRDRRAQLAERERDVAAREAVVEERARIARELHDVIAHHVSMMVVQAGAERRVLDEANGSTREVLETIEQIGRGALTEMRRLRRDAAQRRRRPARAATGARRPADARRRSCARPACRSSCTVEGERRELPVGIELSAYRIVQEALTNALKHAGDARATVHVRYGADSLELEIVDDGAGRRDARVERRPRPRRDARAGRALRRPLDAEPAPERRLRGPRAAADPMTTVLIADDQALVRVGLRKILESEPETTVVGEAADGEEAVAQARPAAARRGADGHPDAGARRDRGDPADRPRAARDARPDPDDVRARQLRLRRAARRRERVHAQGRAAGGDRRRGPDRRERRRAARACGHARRDRGVRTPTAPAAAPSRPPPSPS